MSIDSTTSAPDTWRLRIDTGGTFTDCWALPPDGDTPRLAKVLSSGRLRLAATNGDAANEWTLALPKHWQAPDGFFRGFRGQARGIPFEVVEWRSNERSLKIDRTLAPAADNESIAVDLETGEEAPVLGARVLTGTALGEAFPPLDLRLASTRATNALLEGKGSPPAFFVTRGFGDLLRIGDQRRPDLFALEPHIPPPLDGAVVEVSERLDAAGNVLETLDLEDATLTTAAKSCLDRGIRVAAVALLHSYRNPSHEKQLAEYLYSLGFEHVSLSSGLAPLIRILPRAQTAVVNAYLTPVMARFLDRVGAPLGESTRLLIMTSAGGLEPPEVYQPRDSLLSGPAGGVVGAAASARAEGLDRLLTFDMGGTSTDVARYDGEPHYRFEQVVGPARLLAPALKIETVAAGGGSICAWRAGGLRVGPESAGADPGPACYGQGGPLTVTDANLLLGRIDASRFGIPLERENLLAAEQAALELQAKAGHSSKDLEPTFLEGLIAIAVEQMADSIRTISIREGADPAEYTLLAFGGAGPLHACDLADRLGMTSIYVPAEAGILSAFGLQHARVERFAERQILRPLEDALAEIPSLLETLTAEAQAELDDADNTTHLVDKRLAELRLRGQDATISLAIGDPSDLLHTFLSRYRELFGYDPPKSQPIELVALRVVVAATSEKISEAPSPSPIEHQETGPDVDFQGSHDVHLDRASLPVGARIEGPRVLQDSFATCWLARGWRAEVRADGALLLSRTTASAVRAGETAAPTENASSAIQHELFRHRFQNLVEEMGAMLQHAALSTNVKERLDFSCALLDARGELVANAPHIPVHLGALGLGVREMTREAPLGPGDVLVCNHPGFGGSHLPDVTVVSPVHDASGVLRAYVANRAHHAEIGGMTPGSMPPQASCLAEEGVVVPPFYLFRKGEARWEAFRDLLETAPWPSRRTEENLADLSAQVAANRRGAAAVRALLEQHGADSVATELDHLAGLAQGSLRDLLHRTGFREGEAEECLDDGTPLHLSAQLENERLRLDFTGSGDEHPGNLNATPAIVRSAILYVLRLWTGSDLPLNEGLLRDVDVILPPGLLNPRFSPDPLRCPAVVGGNVETSQRLVDTLVKLLHLQACSQGTMNNLIFGNDQFGYYETIGGGGGAGPDYDGASGRHSHMTNTAITDAEILEQRYPVRLRRFALRSGSGGAGRHRGGDGLIRELEFLEPLEVSLLTQHRKIAPFGCEGGEAGACGVQTRCLPDGREEVLPAIAAFRSVPGERLVIETPGGGGWGSVGDFEGR